MKELTYSRVDQNGKLVEFTYSETDKELIESRTWYMANTGYIMTDFRVNRRPVRKQFHRLVMGEPEGMVVDHIDGNPLNNTRENLRICTQQENTRNSKKERINNSSGCVGVSFNKATKKWRAYIVVDYKQLSLGYYKTKEEAIDARKIGEKKHFGEFNRD